MNGSIVRFTYGNTWEDVPIEKPENAEEPKDGEALAEQLKTNNKWSMELSINNGEELSGKFI